MRIISKLLIAISIIVFFATTVAAQDSVVPGPCFEKRKQVYDYLVKAKKAGMGTAPYEKALAQIENEVKSGTGEEDINKRLNSLTTSIAQQVNNFKAMKAVPPSYRAIKPSSKASDGSVNGTTGMSPGGSTRLGRRTSTDEMESYLLTLVNKHRSQAGLGSLSMDSLLSSIARGHALDMIKRKFFDHVNPSGEDPRARAAAGGYSGFVRENIAYTDPMGSGLVMIEFTDKGLMDSPGHRKNILAPQGATAGIGVVYDSRGGISVCQLFSP